MHGSEGGQRFLRVRVAYPTVQTSAAPSEGPNGVATRRANGVTL